jgi:transcriptional regulator with XRE-family HTH domain
MELGIIIRQLRTEKGMKQENMAERIGISQSAYSRYENGYTRITTDVLEKIARELCTTVHEIYDRERNAGLSHTQSPAEKRNEFVYKSPLPDSEETLYNKLLNEKDRQIQQKEEENKELRRKLESREDEIRDLNQEFRIQNEALLDKMMKLEKEMSFLKRG